MSTKKSRRPLKKAIDRPFEPATLRRARQIVKSYCVVMNYRDGLYYGHGLELPDVMSHGKTIEECDRATREMLTTVVAYLLETGETPPAPIPEDD